MAARNLWIFQTFGRSTVTKS